MLPSDGIFVIWNYTVHVYSEERYNQSPEPPSSDSSCSDLDDDHKDQLHSLTFKCVGSTKVQSYQEVLEKVEDLLENGASVGVRLIPEPNNPVDAKAISFQCYYSGSWVIIGYVLHEILDDVHFALNNNLITNVEFETVKYIPYFSNPGWYAGV